MAKNPAKHKKHPVKKIPTHEELEKAAYFNWLNRGGPLGDPITDWYEAENKWRDNIVPENND